MRITTDFNALATYLVTHGVTETALASMGYQLCQGASWNQVFHCLDRLSLFNDQPEERIKALGPLLPRYVRKTMTLTADSILAEAIKVKAMIRHESVGSRAYKSLLDRTRNIAGHVSPSDTSRAATLSVLALDIVATRANIHLRFADSK